MIRLFFGLLLFFGLVFSANAHEVQGRLEAQRQDETRAVPNPSMPRAIFLGDIDQAPKFVKNMMPTGYSTTQKAEINAEIRTGHPEESIAYFAIDDTGRTDIDQIMKWAANQGKTNVYFKYIRKANEQDSIINNFIPLQDFVFDAVGIANFNWREYLISLISAKDLHANPVPSKGTRASSSDVLIPSGSCYRITWVDDVPGDGLKPSADFCFFYQSYFFGHMFPMVQHMRRNIAHYDNGNIESVADCMSNQNPGIPHRRPVNFDVRIYVNGASVPSCGSGASGCSIGGPNTSFCQHCPNCNYANLSSGARTIIGNGNNWIELSEVTLRNQWRNVRHETMHQYGYSHCHMDADYRSSGECIGRLKGGYCFSGGTNCGNPPQPNGHPDHIFK